MRFLIHGWLAIIACLIVHAASFPAPFNSEKRGEPLAATGAAASFKLPPGFKVSVFASEPDLNQPIALTFDPRGRLWVAENYTYAEAGVNFATNLSDRVLIFEDKDHDGRFDRRTVFWDQAQILTSVEVGLGGVFVLCPPKLLFLADRNGDDVPDGEPEVLLDGFTTTTGNRHTFANGLKWGPDGWLWGRIGISSGAKIGVPGAPDTGRVEMRGGVWRYHPARRVFEAVSHGTTNPWGLDWNEVGEPFFINTVIGHLWHAIPGAHFQRMHGDDVDPHAYALIGQHADHYHFDTGAGWQKSRAAFDGSTFAAGSDELGGGHAHCGLMIYQGDNWPADYRGKLFTINLHGRRLNVERLERQGSGYVGKHDRDFLQVGDPWFRGIDLIQGPDGGVFIADWSDTGECHDHDGVHRTSGRIYKLTYGEPKPPKVGDLTRLTPAELKPLLFDRNEWLARQARRELANRAAVARLPDEFTAELRRAALDPGNPTHSLRALWAATAVSELSSEWLDQLVRQPDEHLQSWAVRLLADRASAKPDEAPAIRESLFRVAAGGPPPLTQLYLAAALQHLPPALRWKLADALVGQPGVKDDHNLPLLLWTGIEPLVAVNPEAARQLAKASASPLLRQFIARRLAEDLESKPQPVADLLTTAISWPAALQADLIRGLADGLKGWRKAPAPPSWAQFAAAAKKLTEPGVSDRLRDLEILFGDGRALDDLRTVAADPQLDSATRRQALKTLLDNRADNLSPLLRRLANDGALRAVALIGLMQIGDPEAAEQTVGRYQWLGLEERPAVLAAMVSRPATAKALLDAVAAGTIRRSELTPFLARQIASLNQPALTTQLGQVWGTLGQTDAEKAAALERFRGEFSPTALKSADLSQGRAVFARVCAGCHQLYGEGQSLGPDLTGSGRADLGYLLDNLVTPSAVVAADYRMAVATLKDGRVLNGVLREQTDRTVTIHNQTDRPTLDRRELTSLELSDQSLMPEGLLDALSPAERRDLVAYLMHPRQVPLPPATK